jgi:hypothetical protein
MFQRILESILKRYIGEYVEDADNLNLNTSITSGEVNLRDLKLKQDIC